VAGPTGPTGPAGTGTNISVSDEGTLLTAGVTSFDFVGSGVTATAAGTAVTVTISGGGGGGGASYATYTFTGDGSTTSFNTTVSGLTVNNVLVLENGITQVPTTDYTISGTSVVFTTAPASGVAIQIRILGGGGGTGGTATILESIRTITSNYTVTDGYNGLSVGPVTINTSVGVTVGTGERWVVMNF
jgi:hypothetical protein